MAARPLSDAQRELIRRATGAPADLVLADVLEHAATLALRGLEPPALARLRQHPGPERAPQQREELPGMVLDGAWRALAQRRLKALSARVLRGEAVGGPGDDASFLVFAGHALRQFEVREGLAEAKADPASLHAGLGSPDQRAIYDLLLGSDGVHSSIDGYVEAWTRLTRDPSVTQGESEWRSSLGCRDLCEQAVQACTPPGAARLRAALEPPDVAFLDGTDPWRYPVGIGDQWEPVGWWWSRVPRDDDGTFRAAARIVSPADG